MVPRPPGLRLPPEATASALLLVIPFWTFLHYHAYSVFRPDAVAIALALAAVGAAVGGLMRRASWTLVRVVLMTGWLLVSLDLLFDMDGHLGVAAAVLLGLTWVLRTHMARIVIAMTLAYGASTFAFGAHVANRVSGTEPAARRGGNPPLVHIIADAHIGIDGIPTDVEGGAAAKAALIAFYVEHGFRLYTRAYSEKYLTAGSIPSELNFAETLVGYSWLGGPTTTFPAALVRNRYFERLAHAGYDIRVYQPGFIDYCAEVASPPSSCFTVPQNSLNNLAALNLDWYSRVRVVAGYWVENQSHLYRSLRRAYEQGLRPTLRTLHTAAPAWRAANTRLGPAGALVLLRRLRQDIATAPSLGGTAFFVHVLLPHGPYLVDEHCQGKRGIGREPTPLEDPAEERRAQYRQYLPQMRCLTLQVDSVVAALESRGAGNAVVILQGDHGARIGTPPPTHPPLTREKFQDFYSTLFAIRAPGVAPGVDTTVTTKARILDRFSGSAFTSGSVPSDSAPHVFLLPRGVKSAERLSVPVPEQRRP